MLNGKPRLRRTVAYPKSITTVRRITSGDLLKRTQGIMHHRKLRNAPYRLKPICSDKCPAAGYVF
jgi:hypothetical protein